MSTRRLKTLRMTCPSCPTQWEGQTDDGEDFYAHYRWGYLTWGFGDGLDNAVDASLGCEAIQLGEDLDGELGTSEMLKHVGLIFA